MTISLRQNDPAADPPARIWLDHIFKKELGQAVDWIRIDKEDYLLAMERSPVRDTEIKILLRNALTDNIHDRELFMMGIDHSYAYEGYTAYKTNECSIASQNGSGPED